MELKVNDVLIPERITFNYEELKAELAERVKMYETLVYTEDEIKQAKADKASLNKLKKALNDERIRREKLYMEPFNEFKAQINEIIAIIDKPIGIIDKQVKEYELKKQEEKANAISEYWNSIEKPDWLDLGNVYNNRWLNATYSMKQIQEDINGILDKIKQELDTLSNLPEFRFEAIEVFKYTLDINKAISEGKRLADLQKMKELQKQADFSNYMNPPEPIKEESQQEEKQVGQWVNFSAFLTVAQAVELKDFFNSRGIQFKAI